MEVAGVIEPIVQYYDTEIRKHFEESRQRTAPTPPHPEGDAIVRQRIFTESLKDYEIYIEALNNDKARTEELRQKMQREDDGIRKHLAAVHQRIDAWSEAIEAIGHSEAISRNLKIVKDKLEAIPRRTFASADDALEYQTAELERIHREVAQVREDAFENHFKQDATSILDEMVGIVDHKRSDIVFGDDSDDGFGMCSYLKPAFHKLTYLFELIDEFYGHERDDLSRAAQEFLLVILKKLEVFEDNLAFSLRLPEMFKVFRVTSERVQMNQEAPVPANTLRFLRTTLEHRALWARMGAGRNGMLESIKKRENDIALLLSRGGALAEFAESLRWFEKMMQQSLECKIGRTNFKLIEVPVPEGIVVRGGFWWCGSLFGRVGDVERAAKDAFLEVERPAGATKFNWFEPAVQCASPSHLRRLEQLATQGDAFHAAARVGAFGFYDDRGHVQRLLTVEVDETGKDGIVEQQPKSCEVNHDDGRPWCPITLEGIIAHSGATHFRWVQKADGKGQGFMYCFGGAKSGVFIPVESAKPAVVHRFGGGVSEQSESKRRWLLLW